MLDQDTLEQIEERYPRGMTSQEILDLFAEQGVPVGAATLRKYVQLGLLPQSTRVGQKGKHSGSRGVYPVAVVRQLARIKEMLARRYTIAEIQRDFLFVRRELDQLEEVLSRVFATLRRVAAERGATSRAERLVEESALLDAKAMGRDLLGRLMGIEARLAVRGAPVTAP